MIGDAVYALLNVTEITDLVGQLSYGIAPQNGVFPRVVITESGTPENFKDGYTITNHDVEINIFASKGKNGNAGFLEASNIADAIEKILYRYKGIVNGKVIQQTLLSNTEILFDNTSQCARVIMEYGIRESKREIFEKYEWRVTSTGGTLENTTCLRTFITTIT